MNTQRDLLFGMVAFQTGAVEADRLAETCAEWSADRTVPLADRLVDRGCLTIEQKSLVDSLVAEKLKNHGGDAEATLAATVDGRFLDAIRDVSAPVGDDMAHLAETLAPGANYEVLGSLSPGEDASSNRYTRTHLHAKGGMGQVWVARDGSLGRQIALKELRPEQTDNSIDLLAVPLRGEDHRSARASRHRSRLRTRWRPGSLLHDAVRQRPHPERGNAVLPQGSPGRNGRLARSGQLAERVSRSVPCRCVCPFAGSYSPRSQRAERDSGRLRRGHRARLGHRETGRTDLGCRCDTGWRQREFVPA